MKECPPLKNEGKRRPFIQYPRACGAPAPTPGDLRSAGEGDVGEGAAEQGEAGRRGSHQQGEGDAREGGCPSGEGEVGQLPQGGRKVPVQMGFGVGGIVPQFVSENAEDKVSFMFRPRNVYRNAKVIVEMNGEEVLSKKTMILAPGEMVNLSIPVEKLKGLDKADSILVRIEVPEA